MKLLDKDLHHELSDVNRDLGNKIRKHWRKHNCANNKEKHKNFCLQIGAKLNLNPRTISWIVKNKNWSDLKPSNLKREQGLFKSDKLKTRINLIKNSRLHITASDWLELNNSMTKMEIKNLLLQTIRDNDLEPPYARISQKDADKAFEFLKSFKPQKFIQRMETITRWDYRYESSDVVINFGGNNGNDCSNFYHQRSRWRCDYKSMSGPETTWYNDKYLKTVFNSFWTLKHKKITDIEIRSSLALRKYIASQFKPAIARIIFELFNSKKIYDPSSGWGDRLTGFMASNATHYVSTDPNSSLYDGYNAQKKRYGGNKEINMYCHGSEVKGGVTQYGHTYDTVFTSPPYFNAEKYSEDEGQSFKQFDEIETWLHGFLFKTLKNAWEGLESEGARGGILAINISDIYNDKTKARGEICDPMNDYISTLKGARYIGCIGMRLSKRTQSGAYEDKEESIAVEPIWLWAKGGTWDLDDYIRNAFNNELPKGLW